MHWTVFALATLLSAPYPPGALACMAAPAPAPSEGCLHFDNEVTMADGETWKRASDLSVGDLVSDGMGSTPVIYVPKREKKSKSDFVEFKTENGLGSTVTPNHYVFAGQCERGSWPIKRADNLSIGECVPTANGGEDRIAEINRAKLTGRILPITKSGKIEVGGVTVSCYNSEYEGTTQEDKHSKVASIRQFYDLGEMIYENYGESVLNFVIESLGLDKIYS